MTATSKRIKREDEFSTNGQIHMHGEFNLGTQLFLSILGCVLIYYALTAINFVDEHVDIVWVKNPDTSRNVASTDKPIAVATAGVVPEVQGPVKSTDGDVQLEMSPGEAAVDADRRDYIQRYYPIAIAEMRKYGIPASITLAQGLCESAAGKGKLVRNTNNHFGIKCFSKSCKKGHCKNWQDDSHKDFFVCYKSGWESYRAHSEFLKKTPRYRKAFEAGNNYERFAQCLEDAGYATIKNDQGVPIYADNLIRLIRLYHLDRYDR